MSFFRNFALALAVTALPVSVSAASLTPGVYSVDDITYNGNVRSIWTPGGNSGPNSNALVQGAGVSAYWSFSDVVLNYGGTVGPSTMTGTAVNLGQSELQFDVSINLSTATFPGAQTGYCQFTSSGSCSGSEAALDDDWAFMDILAGSTFAGSVGTLLDGIEWEITDKSGGSHPPQVGINANALVLNGLQGISFWFDFDQIKGGSSVAGANQTYSINDSGYGDVNSNLNPVPLPGAGMMLLGALGAGAIAARRRNRRDLQGHELR